MAEGVRVGIRLNQDVDKRLQQYADNYGMTKNSLITFILGQWVDNNIKVKEQVLKQLSDKLDSNMSLSLDNKKTKDILEYVAKIMMGDNNFSVATSLDNRD